MFSVVMLAMVMGSVIIFIKVKDLTTINLLWDMTKINDEDLSQGLTDQSGGPKRTPYGW
jgi:hypothetical protein